MNGIRNNNTIISDRNEKKNPTKTSVLELLNLSPSFLFLSKFPNSLCFLTHGRIWGSHIISPRAEE